MCYSDFSIKIMHISMRNIYKKLKYPTLYANPRIGVMFPAHEIQDVGSGLNLDENLTSDSSTTRRHDNRV